MFDLKTKQKKTTITTTGISKKLPTGLNPILGHAYYCSSQNIFIC